MDVMVTVPDGTNLDGAIVELYRETDGHIAAEVRAMREAATLRDAATILSERARRHTFMLEVIIRLLERTASKLDHPSG